MGMGPHPRVQVSANLIPFTPLHLVSKFLRKGLHRHRGILVENTQSKVEVLMILGRVSTLFPVVIAIAFFLSATAPSAAASAAGSGPPEVATQAATVVSTAQTDTAATQSTATRDADDLSWHSIDGGGG